MSEKIKFPLFDDWGINIADHNDSLGLKTKYISLVQGKALAEYLGNCKGGIALDIGCGYGRMSDQLSSLGLSVTGVEPSEKVLEIAKTLYPEHEWLVGQLPDLPVEKNKFDIVSLFNVARSLHLLGVKDLCGHAVDYLAPGGKLIIIDNLKRHDDRYIPSSWFDDTFINRCGLSKVIQVPIRSSRWPIIYLIRYGLIPSSWFARIASWELSRMKKKRHIPTLSYYNFIFIYEKKNANAS